MAKTFWVFMKERHGAANEAAFDSYSDIVEYTARLKDFHRLKMRTLPVAHARNAACQAFWEVEKYPQDPNDTLVMLDADHIMQPDIVEKLAAHTVGVVGALATSRGEIPFLCFFGKGKDGQMYNLSQWEDNELAEGIVVGSGAIAIKRWVLQKLEDCAPSWFRYQYGGYRFEATEEMFFGYKCAAAGIPHYCDTSLWIPHCTMAFTTPAEWRDYFKDHPEVRAQVAVPEEFADVVAPPSNGNGHRQDQGATDKWENIGAIIKRI